MSVVNVALARCRVADALFVFVLGLMDLDWFWFFFDMFVIVDFVFVDNEYRIFSTNGLMHVGPCTGLG